MRTEVIELRDSVSGVLQELKVVRPNNVTQIIDGLGEKLVLHQLEGNIGLI